MKKKIILSILALLIVTMILIISAGYIFGFVPAISSSKNKLPNPVSNSPTIPISPNPQIPPLTTITFDFDRGTQTILEGQSTPLNQTSDGLIASFSSASDPSAFSIQSYKTTFYILSQFSNKYLYDNKITRDILYIAFSQPLTKISFTFATIEYEGPGHVEEPSIMKLTAYMDSIFSSSIDSAYANGNFSNSSFPQGKLSYDSKGKPFNLVKIELLYQVHGGTDFLIDNIIVTTAP